MHLEVVTGLEVLPLEVVALTFHPCPQPLGVVGTAGPFLLVAPTKKAFAQILRSPTFPTQVSSKTTLQT